MPGLHGCGFSGRRAFRALIYRDAVIIVGEAKSGARAYMRGPMGNRSVPVVAGILAVVATSWFSPPNCWPASVSPQGTRQNQTSLHLERAESLLRQGNLKGAADA